MEQAFAACGALVFLVGGAHLILHDRTGGRSGPVVGAAFVLFGPVLGVLVVVGELANQQRKVDGLSAGSQSQRPVSDGAIFGLEAGEYVVVVLAIGLIASLAAGLVYSQMIADEIAALREDRYQDRPRPVVAPSLHALGLTDQATLEQVESAFRELVKVTHPDAGGDAASFKRLQRNYEIAKQYVMRRAKLRARMTEV